MKIISEDAGLTKIYTNHSIRATCLTRLDSAGFEVRHIQAVSGHKSEESIKSYSKLCPDNKKRDMADALNLDKEASNPPLPPLNPNDIVDFVPIDDNAQDFDLGQILNDITEMEKREKNNEKRKAPAPQKTPLKEVPVNTTPQQPRKKSDEKRNEPSTSSAPKNSEEKDESGSLVPSSQNNVMNQISNRAQQFIPRMIFKDSNVTIHYHIHQ